LTIGFLVVSYLVSASLFVLVNLIEKSFLCTFNTLLALKTMNTVELIVIYSLILITLLSDIIPNYKLILSCKWIQYILYNDPYYFRAQIFMFLPFMMYSLVIEFVSLAITKDYGEVVQNFGPTIILNTIQVSILLIIDVVFPLVMTIIELIKRGLRRKKVDKGIESYLMDSEIEKLFVSFSEREYSLENILCYQDIREFKSSLKDPLNIYFRYFNGNSSVMEVNVPGKQCQIIYDQLKSGQFDVHLFDEIEKTIITNLSDTWSRFRFEHSYTQYIEKQKSEKEMIEGK
jgi:hypothetical protein